MRVSRVNSSFRKIKKPGGNVAVSLFVAVLGYTSLSGCGGGDDSATDEPKLIDLANKENNVTALGVFAAVTLQTVSLDKLAARLPEIGTVSGCGGAAH